MINIDNKKINAIKLGTNNYKRAYVGNNLVFQQGKWVFYKTINVSQSRVPEYHERLLTVEKESPNGGKFIFMLRGGGAGAMIQYFGADTPLFMLDNENKKDTEAYVLDFKLKDKYNNYLLTTVWGKFDVAKKRFYDGHIYEKDRNVGTGWIEAYYLPNTKVPWSARPYSIPIDIYKWQEE